MVAIVTGLGRTGLQEWVIQRATAMLLVAYSLFMLVFYIKTPNITFDIWQSFFDVLFVKIATLIALMSLVAHSWIGLWTVITDYVKHFFLRLLFQIIVNLFLMGYVVFGVDILWGLNRCL